MHFDLAKKLIHLCITHFQAVTLFFEKFDLPKLTSRARVVEALATVHFGQVMMSPCASHSQQVPHEYLGFSPLLLMSLYIRLLMSSNIRLLAPSSHFSMSPSSEDDRLPASITSSAAMAVPLFATRSCIALSLGLFLTVFVPGRRWDFWDSMIISI